MANMTLDQTHLVVEAWARMLPPIGFLSFPAYGPAAASGLDMTWFVITTAIPNYHERCVSGVVCPGRTCNAPRPRGAAEYVGICPDEIAVQTARRVL